MTFKKLTLITSTKTLCKKRAKLLAKITLQMSLVIIINLHRNQLPISSNHLDKTANRILRKLLTIVESAEPLLRFYKAANKIKVINTKPKKANFTICRF